MKSLCVMAAAAAAWSSSGTCFGQASTSLYLLKTESLAVLCESEAGPGVPASDNRLWIGHNPSAIAYGQGRLFVGGILNGSTLPRDGSDADGDQNSTETTPFNVAMVRIDNILTGREFSSIPASRTSVPGPQLGYTGLDYAANQGAAVRGLVASVDFGGSGSNQVARFNVDAGAALVAPLPSLLTGFRLGSSGVAWDFGPTGNGVDFAPAGGLDGVPDGPVIAASDFGTAGPYGLDPSTLNGGFGATLYEVGVNNGPRLTPDAEPGRQWRDFAIDRRNGNIAARADNHVVFARRNVDGTATRIDLSPADPNTERLITTTASSIPHQRIAILSGFDDTGVGDLLIWNDRAATTNNQPFDAVVRFNKTDRVPASDSGAPVQVAILNPDNTPVALPGGNGHYDFAWDRIARVLFVLDSANRCVYVLSKESPVACCAPDGGCALLSPITCTSAGVGGTPGAAGSTCAPNPCAQPVLACCFTGGSCQPLLGEACLNAGGFPQAFGVSCSPALCTAGSGACCNGATCSVVSPAACAGSFRGGGSTCDFPSNPVTCCRANFNALGGVTVQDIFDYLSAYFLQSPTADINARDGVTVQDIFDFLSLYFVGCN